MSREKYGNQVIKELEYWELWIKKN